MQSAGAEPIVWARSGWLGSHRHPVHWTGDAQSTWEGMRGSLRGGLSLSLSGIVYWSCDIGGMYAQPQGTHDFPDLVGAPPGQWPMPDGELYARWAFMGSLLSHTRYHGVPRREPYHFAADVRDAAREASRLRYRLLPEILRAAGEGLPVVRPLVLEFPDDVRSATEETQFMLGPNLLVAPVLEPGGRRDVYLPPGEWVDWWSGERLHGAVEIEVDMPLDRIPLYQRAGSTVLAGPGGVRVAEALAGGVEERRA
jgi:alpha-D-xyloside xylohydrolase